MSTIYQTKMKSYSSCGCTTNPRGLDLESRSSPQHFPKKKKKEEGGKRRRRRGTNGILLPS
jgi:hypothetical protein